MLVYHQPPIPNAVRHRGKYDPIMLTELRSNHVKVNIHLNNKALEKRNPLLWNKRCVFYLLRSSVLPQQKVVCNRLSSYYKISMVCTCPQQLVTLP